MSEPVRSSSGPTLEEFANQLESVDRKQGSIVGSIIILGICVLYLLNLTFGFDILPDNLPVIGNLDEVGVTWLAFRQISNIGLARSKQGR